MLPQNHRGHKNNGKAIETHEEISTVIAVDK